MAPITIVGSIRLASRYGRVIRLALFLFLSIYTKLHLSQFSPCLTKPVPTWPPTWGHLSRFPPCLTRLTWRLILRRYPESWYDLLLLSHSHRTSLDQHSLIWQSKNRVRKCKSYWITIHIHNLYLFCLCKYIWNLTAIASCMISNIFCMKPTTNPDRTYSGRKFYGRQDT